MGGEGREYSVTRFLSPTVSGSGQTGRRTLSVPWCLLDRRALSHSQLTVVAGWDPLSGKPTPTLHPLPTSSHYSGKGAHPGLVGCRLVQEGLLFPLVYGSEVPEGQEGREAWGCYSSAAPVTPGWDHRRGSVPRSYTTGKGEGHRDDVPEEPHLTPPNLRSTGPGEDPPLQSRGNLTDRVTLRSPTSDRCRPPPPLTSTNLSRTPGTPVPSRGTRLWEVDDSVFSTETRHPVSLQGSRGSPFGVRNGLRRTVSVRVVVFVRRVRLGRTDLTPSW